MSFQPVKLHCNETFPEPCSTLQLHRRDVIVWFIALAGWNMDVMTGSSIQGLTWRQCEAEDEMWDGRKCFWRRIGLFYSLFLIYLFIKKKDFLC